MQLVDKETFSYWVTHPDDLTATDYRQLQESLDTYPYCQALHTLTAKAASIHSKGQTITLVRQAAAHALSRNALRKLIDNEFQWSDNLLTRLNELSLRHVPIPDDYQQESYALFKSRPGLANGLPRLPLIRLPKPAFPDETEPTVPPVDDPTIVEKALQDDLAQLPAPEAASPEPPKEHEPQLSERQRQLDLIENFIKNEPRISPVRSKPGEQPEQEDLAKRGFGSGGMIVTEAFAKILLKQGKVDKAVEVYEKLSLKNPEKKAYFAAKIAELKPS